MSNVIEFRRPERRRVSGTPFASSQTKSRERLSLVEMVDLMRFRFSDTAIETDDGIGYLDTPEAHERFREFCAAFGFDIDEYPSVDEKFALWHALADSLIGHVLMCLRHPETFELVKVVRPPEWAYYLRAVAEQDLENVRKYRHIAEAHYAQAVAEYAGM